MAFSFTSPPTEAPIPLRQPATLRWTDNAVTIDTWLVEMYYLNMNNSVGALYKSAYVGIGNLSNNAAAIDMQEWAESGFSTYALDPWQVFESSTYKSRASATTLQSFADNVTAFQFQVYSVTGGVKSAVQGTHNYRPITYATNQPWEWSLDFSDYYPDAATKKGWMTSRNVESDLTIRYQMAEEDEAVGNLLQMQNANYVYTGTTNLSDSDWRTINYQLYYNGAIRDVLNLTLTPGTTWNQAWITIPIGPANIKDNANWTLSYPWSNGWDYYTIQVQDAGSSPLSREIRVDKDCRPLKHQPAQLYWIGSRGGAEILRFDGRVKDNYDVSGRETYSISNRYYENAFSGTPSAPYLKFLPQRVFQMGKGKRSFVLSEDFFTDSERELFKSAVASRFMMVRYSGQWFPCRLKSTNYTHEQASSRLLPITCEVELSQDLLC